MARSSLQLILDQRTPVVLNDKSPKAGRQLLRKVIRHLEGVLGGAIQASHLEVWTDAAQPVAATGTVTCANALAADTVTVAGVVFTAVNGGTPGNNEFDISGASTAEATDLARSINASTTAIISSNIEACNLTQTVTLSSCTAGTGVSILGHEFIAVSAANATDYASYGDFSIAGNDTADASALVVAINAHPVLSHYVFATSSAGVVTVRQRRGTASAGSLLVIAKAGVTPSGLSVGGASFAAGAAVMVSCKVPGAVGNAIPLISSNGTRLAILGSATALAGGTGNNVAPVRIVLGGSAQ